MPDISSKSLPSIDGRSKAIISDNQNRPIQSLRIASYKLDALQCRIKSNGMRDQARIDLECNLLSGFSGSHDNAAVLPELCAHHHLNSLKPSRLNDAGIGGRK